MSTESEPTMVRLELPFPPSVNHYYRRVGPRTLISAAGRRFREHVCRLLSEQNVKSMDGRLAISIEVFPPDRRKRDLDNLLKALLDAVQHGGAYPDDSRIIWILIVKAEVVRGGRSVVTIRDLGEHKAPPPVETVWGASLN